MHDFFVRLEIRFFKSFERVHFSNWRRNQVISRMNHQKKSYLHLELFFFLEVDRHSLHG